MLILFRTGNGMNIIGQGGKIIFFTLPFAAAAILIHLYSPGLAALPREADRLQSVGYILLIPGILLWIIGLVQLLKDFPKGKLITTGAYGICRNPIYSSMILFTLPAISLLTLTWVYAAVALFLLAGVSLFIGKEEKQLSEVFGNDYDAYKSRFNRILPFVKPCSKK
jgi:protein-S-isoprenylcysteine O-methyltransferase Ste14